MGFRRRFLLSLGISLAGTAAARVLARRHAGLAAAGASARASLRTSSSPSVRWYEAVFERVLGSFHAGVAGEVARRVAALAPGAGTPVRALEIGPGPGGLALRLAARIPNLDLTGLDIDPSMAARATARAEAAGVADRVRFTVGDVAALPFRDGAFDLVLSTFSVHHWADAPAGFAEIRRVLRPGGRVLIHDLPDAWGRFEAGAPPLLVAAAAAFPGATVTPVAWPGRLSLVRRLDASVAAHDHQPSESVPAP